MKFFSVFSGIEAASVAWHPLGWECVGVAEVEKFPCAVLAHHYPNVPNMGDVTKFKEWSNVPAFDVLVGGSPCQSFSVAGLRKGLADPRGNLMLTYLAIAGEYRPEWILWENVPGVLSIDGGRAFGSFLGGLAELGYGFAYRVLDAQHFGVPQRRRRVFVVGYLGDWRRAAAVLFERESLSGDSAPRREARETTSHSLSPFIGASGRGFSRTGDTRGQDAVVAEVSQTLRNHPRPGSNSVGNIVGTLQANGKAAGSATQQDAESGLLVAHTTGAGFWKEGIGTLRGRPQESHEHLAFGGNNQSGPIDVSTALSAHAGPAGRLDFASETFVTTLAIRGRGDSCDLEIRDDGTANALLAPGGGRGGVGVGAIAIQECAVRENAEAGPQGAGFRDDDQAYTLEARPVPQAVAFDLRNVTSVANRSNPKPGDPMHTLHDPGEAVVAFDCKAGGDTGFAIGDQVGALRGEGHGGGHAAIAFSGRNRGAEPKVKRPERPPLSMVEKTGAIDSTKPWNVATAMHVRRITPTEAERLQGFPDGWTAIPFRGKPAADGPRYKALGNSMAVPCMAWLGRRIQLVSNLA